MKLQNVLLISTLFAIKLYAQNDIKGGQYSCFLPNDCNIYRKDTLYNFDDTNAVTAINYYDINNKYIGGISFDTLGKKSSEDNMVTGTSFYWYPSGQIEIITVNNFATRHKLTTEFYENGVIRRKFEQIDYFPFTNVGKSYGFYETGELGSVLNHDSINPSYLYYREGSKLCQGVIMNQFQWSGQYKEFYPNGQLAIIGESYADYTSTKSVNEKGIWKTYNKIGFLIRIQHYEKGRLIKSKKTIFWSLSEFSKQGLPTLVSSPNSFQRQE